MTEEFSIGPKLPELVDRIVASYRSDERTQRIDRHHLPSRARIIELTELLLELVYPGYFGRQDLNTHNVGFHVGELLPRVGNLLFDQIYQCLCYQDEAEGKTGGDRTPCDRKARRLTSEFLEKIPEIRDVLAGDVQAAYDGDPAASNTDEVILAYPGVLAVSVYRLAHELYEMDVPLMPRIMTEWAHTHTGVDLHPGATIGLNFFIDHATGVVVGETTHIGDNVKLYQGVTLGALSFPKDERGRLIRGNKRHPTVEDDVTVYANATILGGQTTVGKASVVGASVYLAKAVPAGHVVALRAPELKVKPATREALDAAVEPTQEDQES
jgi:serine O-acetyltransferase